MNSSLQRSRYINRTSLDFPVPKKQLESWRKKHIQGGPYSGRALPDRKELYLSKGLQWGNCLNSCCGNIFWDATWPLWFLRAWILEQNHWWKPVRFWGSGLQGSQGRHLVNDFEGIRTSAASTWLNDDTFDITETATNEAKSVTLERSTGLNGLSISHNLTWLIHLIQAGCVYHCIIWLYIFTISLWRFSVKTSVAARRSVSWISISSWCPREFSQRRKT